MNCLTGKFSLIYREIGECLDLAGIFPPILNVRPAAVGFLQRSLRDSLYRGGF